MINPLRLGIFSNLQQIGDRARMRDEKVRQRSLEDALRERQSKQDALATELRLRGAGYVPDAEATEADPRLSGRSLDALVSGATGNFVSGMSDTPSRYAGGPKGYRYDRLSPAAKADQLDARLKEAQTKKAEHEANEPYKTSSETPVSWQTVETRDGIIQVNPRTGERRPLGVQAPAKEPKEPSQPNESERKAAGMLKRVQGVSKTVDSFDNRKTLDEIASRSGMLGNWASSPGGRRLRAAGLIWATSVLRPESGATIGDKELDSYFEMYLPRPGDDEETLQFKREQRRVAEEGVLVQAGRAAPQNASPAAPSAPTDPAAWLRAHRGMPR